MHPTFRPPENFQALASEPNITPNIQELSVLTEDSKAYLEATQIGAESAPQPLAPEVNLPLIPGTLLAQFLVRCLLVPETGCWEWQGKRSHGTRPIFMVFGHTFNAVRASYELFKGRPPSVGVFKKRCHNPLCVCPWHIYNTKAEAGARPKGYAGKKLSPDDVRAIRLSNERPSSIARKYRITPWMVWAIRAGRRAMAVSSIIPQYQLANKEEEQRRLVESNIQLLRDLRRAYAK